MKDYKFFIYEFSFYFLSSRDIVKGFKWFFIFLNKYLEKSNLYEIILNEQGNRLYIEK